MQGLTSLLRIPESLFWGDGGTGIRGLFEGGVDLLLNGAVCVRNPPAEDQSERKMRGRLAELSCPGVAFEDLRSRNTKNAKWQHLGSRLNMGPGSWLVGPVTV